MNGKKIGQTNEGDIQVSDNVSWSSGSTEPKLGTCDVARHANGWVTIAPGLKHIQLVGCVNWREAESAAAQPPPDPSPTPWDYTTWGFYCDACKTFFDLLTDGLIGTTRYHRCGSQARYIGYDHAAVPPVAAAQPTITLSQGGPSMPSGLAWLSDKTEPLLSSPRPFLTTKPCTYQEHAKRIATMLAEGLHDGKQWKPEAHERYRELEQAGAVPPAAETAAQDKCARCGCDQPTHEVEISRSGTRSGYCYAHPQDCPSFETSIAARARNPFD